ncbi:MAG TPA: L-rhamnose/proton symporter RhaT [Terriglobales bacterium]|nr:L-rhamnose/proton symporter RhaT [Terriglobales bacterium]
MLAALMLIFLAGGMNGSFATPMKRVRGWDWEHTWLAWSFVAMVVIPLTVARLTVPNLGAVYRASGAEPFARTAFYGMLWGASAVLFGLGVTRVGLALGFGVILGTASSLGAVVPFVELHRAQLFTTVGLLTLVGVAVVLAGVTACALAGLLRERAQRQVGRGSFVVGLIICLVSGLGSSFMSVALNEATPIFRMAEALGTPTTRSLNAVWPVLLGGGFAVNAAYCSFLVIRHRSAVHFRDEAAANIGLVLAMAVLWSGSNFAYGAGARGMGALGLVLGWPIFMAAIVLTANAWGLLTGEWRGAGRRSVAWAGVGNVLLIVGIWLIASAGSRS